MNVVICQKLCLMYEVLTYEINFGINFLKKVPYCHIECTGNCGYCAHKSKLLKIYKDGILHTKSECEILEHNMHTQNCNPKRNTTYKVI